ncbi:MAG: hypothetical protein QOE92_2380 [Chloroflexota bacterium]|jgi:NAD(P)-dependent dehydrogenase (short-subunit alcohol dehydrogenase family)|nr:hypothetical protein [Chloroflexota bacterium]
MQGRGAVVITGASTGIGEASATRLAAAGHLVFAGVRKQADADRLASASLPNLRPLMIDVADSASIKAAAADVEAAVGDAGIAGLVNNAGLSLGAPLEFQDMDEVRSMINVNVVGLIETTQAFMPLIRRGGGRVVCISSIGGRVATPFVAVYSASKSAVTALCHSLRLELRPWGIKVICIEPGSIATPIWDKGLEEFQAAMAKMPPEALEYYGPFTGRMQEITKEIARRGIPASRVAEVVQEALSAPRPRARYLVGADAKAQSVVGRLPDRARDELLARYIGIPTKS